MKDFPRALKTQTVRAYNACFRVTEQMVPDDFEKIYNTNASVIRAYMYAHIVRRTVENVDNTLARLEARSGVVRTKYFRIQLAFYSRADTLAIRTVVLVRHN